MELKIARADDKETIFSINVESMPSDFPRLQNEVLDMISSPTVQIFPTQSRMRAINPPANLFLFNVSPISGPTKLHQTSIS